ncbi:MAG TPA: adenylate/guanylate cyclase domain-containing protein [Stellaceae bacterium]|nr:adenylate/guanylate cyclase domain-containing protein [Stellaceae bacterium]
MASSVTDWLRELGLEQYAPAFRDNDIDRAVLLELTAEDLTGLGVSSIGHRRKLLAAIAALRQDPAQSAMARKAEVAAPTPSGALAERRQLTVLFCDLVGSTELASRLDPEDLREIIAAYHRRVGEVLARHGGFVAKYMGDGVLAYFGYPEAHEDDAERSLRAGLAIAEGVAHLSLPIRQNLAVRIGIASGLVVVGDLLGSGAAQEQAVVGETPNLAARLQALADPNAVIIADATRRQVGALFEVVDLGPQELKGFAGKQRAWRVLGESGVESRFAAFRSGETPLVGRSEELDLLLRRWAQAKTGEGRVVLLSAEAGIGKSRLTEALMERVAGEAALRLRYFCSSHHQDSALHPVVAQIERAAGFTRADAPAAKLQKLAALLGNGTAADDLALLAELLSLPGLPASPVLELPPQRKKELTFVALLRQLESLARQQPVLMVFEDVHWIDPTTRELLDRTIGLAERLPVLLIATFRPEFQPPWVGQPHVSVLALSRLGRREGTALVRELLANAQALPADIVSEIVERTDGVPLFLEEVTKVVLETAAGADAARSTIGSIPGARLKVPPTLQASLMARLDRLGAAAREVAQVGAAIGRDFSHELLLAAAPRGAAETEEALLRLVTAGLVFQRGVAPAAEYQFKHALVQDTAYGSLLRGPRQALHARIAAAMQARDKDIAERAPELIAHHLTEAGEPDAAASWWLEAGQRSAQRSANIEAMAHFSRGLAGLKGLPETPERRRQELALQLAFGPAVFSLKGFSAPQARAAYERARTLAADLGDDRARFAAVWGCWLSGHNLTDSLAGEVGSLSDELSRVAEGLGDPALRLQAHHSAWATMMSQGRLAAVREHVRQGLLLYDRDQHRHHALVYGGHDPGVCGYGQGAVALWFLGYPDAAARSVRDGLDLAATLSYPPSLGHALMWGGVVHCLRRDLAIALDFGERLIALGNEHRLQLYQAVGGIIHGWALATAGRVEEGLPELRQAVAAYGAAAKIMLGLYTTMLAEAELGAGSPAEALRQLEAAERRAIVGEPFWRTDILRRKAELLAAQDAAAAEPLLQASLDLAREQQAKSLELRAVSGLARLRAAQGRHEDARAALAPILGWFTEGFDTPDLKDAATLLASLE